MTALQTLLEENREEFVDGTLQYAKTLCEDFFLNPKDESGGSLFLAMEVSMLGYRTRTNWGEQCSLQQIENLNAAAEICDRFQQLQNLAQKYAFLMPTVMLGSEELNLDQARRDKYRRVPTYERARYLAFVAATSRDCKKELIKSGSLGLLKYIIESKLENGQTL